MKITIIKAFFIISLFMNLASFAAITCETQVAALTYFKLKDITYMHMEEAGADKTKPLRCDLIPESDIKDIEQLRSQKLSWCQSEEEGKTKQDDLDLYESGFTSKCMKDFFIEKFTSLARSTSKADNIRSLCEVFAPLNQEMYQKEEYCQKVSAAESDPQSCEIPGPDGRCPGAPPRESVQKESVQPQMKRFINWGDNK